MKRRILLPFVLPFLAGSLPAQVATPKIGVARYADSSVRTVFGVSDNFIVSAQGLASADAVSFSDSGGLLSKSGHIQLIAPSGKILAEYDSGESMPILNVDGDLTSAIAWLPTQYALLHWNGKSFVTTNVNAPLFGRVTALRVSNSKTACLLLAEPNGVVSEAAISLDTGNLVGLNVLPGVAAPAFAQQGFVLFHDEHGLEIASGSGAPRTLPLPASDLTFERMSSDWLHLTSPATKQNWALHLTKTVLELSELPPPPARPAEEGQP